MSRPRTTSDETLKRIKELLKRGVSLRGIGKAVGLSQGTVSYYKDPKKRTKAQKKYYQKNREKLIAKMVEYSKKRRDEISNANQ